MEHCKSSMIFVCAHINKTPSMYCALDKVPDMYTKSQCRLDRLLHQSVSAYVLHTVCAFLDDGSLWTVCQLDVFRRCISIDIVRRVLGDLFGDQWEAYYAAFARQSLATQREIPRRSCKEHECHRSVWGLGYKLEFGPEDQINAYAVRNALRALRSLEKACSNYNCSFVPGEPSQYGIDNIAISENGRLLWVKYHSWDDRYKRKMCSLLNRSGSYADTRIEAGEPLTLDGQIWLKSWPVAAPWPQNTKWKLENYGHEIWDLAADTSPICYWSSFWKTPSEIHSEEVGRHRHSKKRKRTSTCAIAHRQYLAMEALYMATPVPSFTTQYFTGHRIPRQRDMVSDLFVSSPISAPSPVRQTFCERPVRFIHDPSSYALVDLLHVERMRFYRYKKLRQPALSQDLRYLGATVRSTDGSNDTILVIWRVELPVPVLLWPHGVQGLCDKCSWTIDKSWLVVYCDEDGTCAYNLECKMPNPICITHYVPQIDKYPIWFQMCGTNYDILYCDGPSAPNFAFVRLVLTKSGEWKACPLSLSTTRNNLSDVTPRGLQKWNYIHSVCRNLVISTKGELFDLEISEDSLENTSEAEIVRPASYSQGWKVVAMHEVPGRRILAAVMRKALPGELEFWELAHSVPRRLNADNGTPIPADEVRSISFSASGKTACVIPQSGDARVWTIRFADEKGTDGQDYSVMRGPDRKFGIGKDGPPITSYRPVFLTDDLLVLQEQYRDYAFGTQEVPPFLGNVSYFVQPGSEKKEKNFGIGYDNVEAPKCLLPDKIRKRLRYTYYRWIDYIREQPRNREFLKSILCIGDEAVLSPGKRFLFFAAHRVPELNAPAHVELRDLTKSNTEPCFNNLRQSRESVNYCLRLRDDYWRPRKRLILNFATG